MKDNQEIFELARLTLAETALMPTYIDDKVMFFGSSAYDKLFEYFCFSGDMPYAIAKARDGDPDYWIIDTLEKNESR